MPDEESPEKETVQVFNVMNHELVPRHEVLPPDEARGVLAKYGVSEDQLPKILATDPAAKACGAKVGDIVKVSRHSLTAGKAVAFRFVVEFA